MVFVTEISNPFDPLGSRRTRIEDKGKALSSYVPAPLDAVVVMVDGRIADDFDVTLDGDHQVIVSPVIQGGGGGKDVLRIVAMIAVAVVAPYAAGAIVGSAGGALAGAGWYSAITAGVMAGGALLINAVLPPQMPSPGNLGGQSVQNSPVYGWSGARTLPRPGEPIPVLYGQMRLPGSVIGQYIKDEGDDEYLYTLLALCEGEIEPISVDDIRINNNAAENYDGVEFAYRVGTMDQANTSDETKAEAWHSGKAIGWFGKVSTANPFSAELSYDTPEVHETLGNAVDEIVVSVTMPGGLYYVNDNGGLDKRSVEFTIEYSADNQNWTTFERVVPQHDVMEYEWKKTDFWTYEYEYTWSDNSPGRDWSKTGRSRTRVVDEQRFDTHVIEASTSSAIRRQYTISGLPPGKYYVRLAKKTEDESGTRAKNTIYWSGMTENVSDRLYYPGIALLGLKIKATGQLSGSAPAISTIVRRKATEVFDESGASVGLRRSDNPAWAAWDILTNKKYGLGKPYDAVDYAAFAEWADWCDQKVPNGFGGYEPRARFNGVVDTQTNIWEALQRVCSVGRAAPVLKGTKYSVIVDKPAMPVQLFSMGNIVKGSYKTTYIARNDIAREIDVEYVDEDAEYTKNAVTVTLGDGGNKSTISSIGTTRQTQAYRLARYMLQCNDKQRRMVEFEAGIDSIACMPGDVIMFAHDVPAWGYSGRVVSGTAGTVKLDRSIDIDASKSYRIVVRYSDDTIEERDVVNPGDGSHFEFAVTSDFSMAPQKHDVYTFGVIGKEYIELRVVSITRKSDQTRKITAIDYNESILDDWTTPDAISRPSHITGFAKIDDISIGEHLEKRKDGTIVPFIDFSWSVADDRSAVVDILVTDDGAHWSEVGVGIRSVSYRMDAMRLEEGKAYTFAFVVSDPSGKQGVSSAVKSTHTFIGKSAPPADVTGLSYKIGTHGIEFTWDANDDADISGYDVYIDGARVNEDMKSTNYLVTDVKTGDHVFGVTAVDTSGNRSVNRNEIAFSVVPPVISDAKVEVIDNNVLLRWNLQQGTMPVASTAVYRSGVFYGDKKGTFTTIFESRGGEYTYCLRPCDMFGNDGNVECVTVTVSDPPGFVLVSDHYSTFDGTKASCLYDKGRLLIPVSTTETFQDHFDNNGWGAPQEQIDAGYPYYVHPSPPSGTYEEVIDHGTVIKNSKISVIIDGANVIDGTLSKECVISISVDGSTWVDYTAWEIYANDFRYVKVRLTVTSDGSAVFAIRNLRVMLSLKEITDSGSVDCAASDTEGTWVAFNKEFYDVNAITLSPQSGDGSLVYAVHTFDDTANPTGISVYLYDTDGNRVDGKCSWIAKGY